MKRVTLCDTAYLELSDEQYNNSKTIEMKSDKNRETLWKAKEIYLPRNMILLVPLEEFEETEEKI
jgi:hypothetical protein